jgi:2-polyprenyl-3-methyl-5-hydroxy-6-metoxy-1,4-benzoquinol methylase
MQRFVGGWHKLKKFPLIQDRFDVIRKHIEGKTVLDCGSGGEEIKPGEEWWNNLFLHKKIKELAKECIGVDNDAVAIKTLTDMGYDIRFADVEHMDLGRQFDVVVAGELIEHLSNPGLFLESIKKHLIPRGKLILTTPNPWAMGNLIRAMFGRRLDINKSHVAWYDLVMLEQLLKRHGFVIEEFYWHQRVFRGVHHLVRLRPNWALNVILVAGKIG